MVGADSPGASGEGPPTADRQCVRANSLNLGTKSDQESREVLNVWLRCRVAQRCGARRGDRSTQSVFCCCDTRLVEKHIGTAQSRRGKAVGTVDDDFRSELLQGQKVRVNAPAADHVSAGWWQLDRPAPCEHWPGEEDRSSYPRAQLGVEAW